MSEGKLRRMANDIFPELHHANVVLFGGNFNDISHVI